MTALDRPAVSGVTLRPLAATDRNAFLAMVHASRELHHPWAYPPERSDQFDELMARCARDDFACLIAEPPGEAGAIGGVFTIGQIVRGLFQSAYVGYYASAEYAGQGLMREGLRQVIRHAFGDLGLHRLEVNIQPGNHASIALAQAVGFRLEGFSPRYLLIGGQWRDHERYAITAEEHGGRGE
jgi:ribosomal-protein-alanine N-acetyltransferase